MEWMSIKDSLPDENETVWAYNINNNSIYLAALVYSDGWLWAVSNGSVYTEGRNIVSECELDDQYEFTHWIPLPKLPK